MRLRLAERDDYYSCILAERTNTGMKILVNHLTRMHGGHICIAGVDLDTRRHVRPVLGREGMPKHLLARYGGPFDMARVVDLGTPRPEPDRPHVEDHRFAPSRLRFRRTASAEEFWKVLHDLAKTRLQEIFASALREAGNSHYATELGQGLASLGCLRPQKPPELYLRGDRQGKPQVRMRLSDGEIDVDASVTDLRLGGQDPTVPDRDVVRGVAKWIQDSDDVLLSVGLTRKFRPSPTDASRPLERSSSRAAS